MVSRASSGTVWFSQNLKAIGSDLEMYMDGREIPVDIAEGYRWRIEMMLRDLVAMETCGELDSCETEALNYLSQAHFTMIQVVENLNKDPVPDSASATMQAPVILSGSIGRPKFDIPHSQLDYLLQSRFSVPDISHLLGVSISTIRRRMTEFNLSVHETYAPISDSDLDRIVEETQQILSKLGQSSYVWIPNLFRFACAISPCSRITESCRPRRFIYASSLHIE